MKTQEPLKVYLAGPINGCSDSEASDWREWFKDWGRRVWDDIQWIDPMRRDYRGRESQTYREIVDLDKRDIANADAVIVMYVKPSVGTSMEVFYAWSIGKPVIVIDGQDAALSPWLVYHSTAVVRSPHAAALKLIEWFELERGEA